MNVNFSVEGELLFRDYLKAALLLGKKLILFQVVAGMTAVLLFMFPSNLSESTKWISFVLYPTIGGLLVFLLIFFREKRAYSAVDKRFHKKTIEIEEKGISYRSESSSAHFIWKDVKKAVFRKEFVLLSVGANQALLIPRRFFQSHEKEEMCIAFIKNHI